MTNHTFLSKRVGIGLILLLSIISVMPFFVSTVKASPSTWSITTVDASLNVGTWTSLALDSNGYPHISYYDINWSNLKYARWTGHTWDFADDPPIDHVGSVGYYSSIAVDSYDHPHISYIDSTNGYLKYAEWNGSTWSTESLHTASSAETSIAIDSSDRPHISYIRQGTGWLSYAVWGGMNWSHVTIDTGCIAQYCSMALDSLDQPHISYYDSINDDLKYARWTGSTWNIETVDSDGNLGVTTSIALDSSDRPHISYYNYTGTDLKYARWTGSTWNTETVDSQDNVGQFSSLALDSNDFPHICYYDQTNLNLKYARWSGSMWNVETADSTEQVGPYCSLALDSGDHPHISYWDQGNSNLKYARAPDEYFYFVSATGFDSNGDGLSDTVELNMDVDTTYVGTLNVFVYAYLKDSGNNVVDVEVPSWSITSIAVEYGQTQLYLPDNASEGYYDVELYLFDEDYNYEDYRWEQFYLYPSQMGLLQGTITDFDTTLPMGEVEISVNGDVYTVTNSTGQYLIELLAGEYEITAEEPEGSLYYSQTTNVTIIAGGITTQDFQLERSNWVLSIGTSGSGTTDPGGAITWPKNTECSVEALPDEGWELSHWLLDSVNVGSANPILVFMDANYNLTAVFTEASQPLFVESVNSLGDQKDIFDLGETIFIEGDGYSPSTTYNLYVVEDITNWTDGTTIPTRVLGTNSTVQSNSEGAIPVTAIWINPQVVGKYDIVVDVNDNGVYDAEVDALDDNDVEVTAGIVIPEFSSILIIPLLVIASVFSILVLKDTKKWQKPLAEKLE